MKKETENQPDYKLGWHYGAGETLVGMVRLFNGIETDGYVVCNVDVEKDTVNGSWEYVFKIVEK